MVTPGQQAGIAAAASLHRERFGQESADEVLARMGRQPGPRRALVTGAAGFLGRHFAWELEARGWEVLRIDPAFRGSTATADGADCRELFRDDPNDPGWLDLVVHCAAVIGGREVIDGDPLATAVNLELDAAMFRWAAVARPGRVLYISSSAVYPVSLQGGSGHWPEVALEERDQWGGGGVPDQVYGWTKLVGEMLAGKLREAGVPVTVVRPFSGYGEDQSLDYPFPSFIARALRRDDPFTVWGDGEQVRDFVHVDDVVVGALEAVENELDGPFNLGTGRPTSFNELARLVCEAAGYAPALEHREAKPTGVRYRVADTSLMGQVYWPRVSLEEGIRRALKAG